MALGRGRGGDMAEAKVNPVLRHQPLTLVERLQQEREEVSSRLADIEAALKAVEANDEIRAAVEALSKLGY